MKVSGPFYFPCLTSRPVRILFGNGSVRWYSRSTSKSSRHTAARLPSRTSWPWRLKCPTTFAALAFLGIFTMIAQVGDLHCEVNLVLGFLRRSNFKNSFQKLEFQKKKPTSRKYAKILSCSWSRFSGDKSRRPKCWTPRTMAYTFLLYLRCQYMHGYSAFLLLFKHAPTFSKIAHYPILLKEIK